MLDDDSLWRGNIPIHYKIAAHCPEKMPHPTAMNDVKLTNAIPVKVQITGAHVLKVIAAKKIGVIHAMLLFYCVQLSRVLHANKRGVVMLSIL